MAATKMVQMYTQMTHSSRQQLRHKSCHLDDRAACAAKKQRQYILMLAYLQDAQQTADPNEA